MVYALSLPVPSSTGRRSSHFMLARTGWFRPRCAKDAPILRDKINHGTAENASELRSGWMQVQPTQSMCSHKLRRDSHGARHAELEEETKLCDQSARPAEFEPVSEGETAV